MYNISIEKFGIYDIYCLSNNKSNCFVKFVLEKGATVSDLRLNGKEIYDGYSSQEDLEALIWSRGIFLAPFPNRLKNGKYSFEGKDYQFPVNEPATGGALHGFLSQLKFSLGDSEINSKSASISCHTFYEGEREYYPFPFHVEIVYSLIGDDELSICMNFTNKGKTNMPVGLGWHPYFNLDKKINDTSLQLPSLEKVEVDSNMIPTGNLLPFTVFESNTKIKDFVLDNCFHVIDKSKPTTVVLEGEKGKLTYKQNSDIPFLQIFIPPHRQSIALEPMTSNIDALNNKDGLKILAPMETFKLECSVNLQLN